MSQGAPSAYPTAIAAAAAAREILAPGCERIELVGSLRRGRAFAGDIDFLVAPKYGPSETVLFGDCDLLEELLAKLLTEKKLSRTLPDGTRGVNGPKVKAFGFAGLILNLFVETDPGAWGWQMVLRTGPPEFSKRIVTSMRLYPEFGLLAEGLSVQNGRLWRDGAPIETPDEAAVFEALGLRYAEPEARDAWR